MLPAEETMLRFEAACIALGRCRQDLQTPEQQRAYNQMLDCFKGLWGMVERTLPMDYETAKNVYDFRPDNYYWSKNWQEG